MFKIILTAKTASDLHDKIREAAAHLALKPESVKAEKPTKQEETKEAIAVSNQPKRKAGRPPAKKSEVAPAAEPEILEETHETDIADLKEQVAPTLDDVRASVRQLNTAKGFPIAKKIFDKYQVGSIAELAPAKYTDFIHACQKAMS